MAEKKIVKSAKSKAETTETKVKKTVAKVEAVVSETIPEQAPKAVATAKAGKRSEKGIKEAEVKQAKEERKAHAEEIKAEAEATPVETHKPARSRLERRSKNYKKVFELVDKTKTYTLPEALVTVIKTSPSKFDASVEMHVNLAVDPRQADQNIRGSVALPSGTGKTVRIAVLADVKDVAGALAAGADKAGSDDLLADLDKGIIDFDILISSPAMMPKLGKYARLLGPKGLMPNPKSGTVTTDVAKAVSEAKAGRVEYRVDSTGIIHLSIGKVSFGTDKLKVNASAVLAALRNAKPASLKGGVFIKSIHLATTMGPSVRVSTTE